MAKDNVHDWSTTANSNSDIGGTSIAEGCLPGNLNDMGRKMMAQLVRAVGNKGSDIASASTCDIAATGTSLYAVITGTIGISSFGTVAAGTLRIIEFDDALTLAHNATSLILPGSTDITTAAGDVGIMISLGSGNWKCLTYQTQSGSVVGGFSSLTATSTVADATAGPDIEAFRNSASPTDNDLIGRFLFNGRNESAAKVTYGSVEAQILDATGGTEDALLLLKTIVGGTLAARLSAGAGIYIGAPTGGDKGSGTLNLAGDLYYNGAQISTPIAQVVRATSTTYETLGTIMPYDNSIPQNTEGDEIMTATITPVSASSTLRIRFNGLFGGGAAGTTMSVALFVDSTAGALFATGHAMTNGSTATNICFEFEVAAASTSARTYKIRAGNSTATDGYLNGDSGGRNYGGVAKSMLTVEEILP